MKFAVAIGTWIVGAVSGVGGVGGMSGGRLLGLGLGLGLGRWLNIRDWWVVVAGKGRVWMGSMRMRRGIRGRGLGFWRGGRHIGKGGSNKSDGCVKCQMVVACVRACGRACAVRACVRACCVCCRIVDISKSADCNRRRRCRRRCRCCRRRGCRGSMTQGGGKDRREGKGKRRRRDYKRLS